MRSSLREVLAESHIAAVAIAVLLFWTFEASLEVLGPPMFRVLEFLITALAIWDVPYGSFGFTDVNMILTGSYLYGAIVSLFAAWLLSRWVFGVGPLRSLAAYRSRVRPQND